MACHSPQRRRTCQSLTGLRAGCNMGPQAGRRLVRRVFVVTLLAGIWSAGLPITTNDANSEEPAPFQPGDISIGEPLQLPLAPPPSVLTVPQEKTVPQERTVPPAEAAGQPAPFPLPPPAADESASNGGPAAPVRPAEPGTGWLGIAVDDSLVTGRLVVVEVAENSPAARAGIGRQDLLLAIDGEPLHSADQLAAALAAIAPGRNVKVSVGRGDRIQDAVMRAETRPPEAIARDWQAAGSVPARTSQPGGRSLPSAPALAVEPAAPSIVIRSPDAPAPFDPPAALPVPRGGSGPEPTTGGRGRTALGVRTLPVDPGVQARFRLSEPAGALVIGVVQDLPASKAGVPPGSVIVALDNQPVRSPNELTQLVAKGPVGTPVSLQYVLPGGEARRAEVSLQSLEVPLERALAGETAPALSAPGMLPPAVLPPAVARRIVRRMGEAATADAVQQTAATESVARESAPATPKPEAVQLELQRLRSRIDRLERRLERLR